MKEAATWESFRNAVEKDTLVGRLRLQGLSDTQIEDVVGEFLQVMDSSRDPIYLTNSYNPV